MTGVSQLRIPRSLVELAAHDDDADFRAWVGTLPAIVSELAERWELSLGEPYEAGGRCSWVAPARRSTGEGVVLKVGWRHFEADHEADGLRFWNGDGAARLYAAGAFDHTSAVLLERCVPGDPLGSVLSETEQDVVIAGLLRRLWQHPPDGHPFRALVTMCDAWADEFEEKLAAAPGFVDAGLARDAMALFRELPRTAVDAVLLCTDLHAQNVLAARREPWLVIDPKPYLGDPAYDPLQHMLNCEDRLVSDPEGFSRRMAELLDLDSERLRQWLFARSVQECFSWPALRDVSARLAP